MNLKPLFDRVVLKPIKKQCKTKSGIIIPETVGDEPLLAEVVSIGNGDIFEGKTNTMFVKTGNKVLYNKYGAVSFKDDGETFLILRQSDILGIFEEESNEKN